MKQWTKLLVVICSCVIWIVSTEQGLCAAAAKRAPKSKGLVNPFFAMDTATGRNTPAEAQARLAKEMGYAGIGCDFAQMPDMLKAVDAAGTKLFSVYVGANVDPAKPKYDPRLKDVITSLKGRDTIIWVFIQGGKPSSTDRDDRAVEIIREIADLAADCGLRVALYPHANFYVERVEDAVRLVKKAERKNVGVTFNLCHWLRVDKEENLKAVLGLAMPHLFLVTINGADSGGKNWDTLIQPLDSGTFDMYAFLKTLTREFRYTGPIGFQGYAIKGEPRDILSRTIGAWGKLSKRIAADEK